MRARLGGGGEGQPHLGAPRERDGACTIAVSGTGAGGEAPRKVVAGIRGPFDRLCAVEFEGIEGVICGRAVYSGDLDFALAMVSPSLGGGLTLPLNFFALTATAAATARSHHLPLALRGRALKVWRALVYAEAL